jgi:hypothetical protein
LNSKTHKNMSCFSCTNNAIPANARKPVRRARLGLRLQTPGTSPSIVWRILIISAVPQITEDARHALAEKVESAWYQAARASTSSCIETSTRLIGASATSSAISLELAALATFLALSSGRRGLVYYNGHGNWAGGDRTRSEWDTWNGTVSAAQVTDAFANTAPGSLVLVVSDSCSSGAMIESTRPAARHGRWALLAACSVSEDAFEENDGGVFTVWGLLPTLVSLVSATSKVTLSALEAGIESRIDIPDSDPLLATGSSELNALPLF